MYQPIQLETKIPSLRNSISLSLVAIITLFLAAWPAFRAFTRLRQSPPLVPENLGAIKPIFRIFQTFLETLS
jgi:hypothetical protein